MQLKITGCFNQLTLGVLKEIVRLSEKRLDAKQGSYCSNLPWESQFLIQEKKKLCHLCWSKAHISSKENQFYISDSSI